MKMLLTIVGLALVQPLVSRGLKAPRAPDASAVLSKQLELENEALKKQNQHLEAMMQMARAEVHRMDVAAVHGARKRQQESCGDTEVLKQEIEDLRKKLQATEADKADVVETLRHMLKKNSTQIFQKQAERAEQMKMALELKCGKEREAFEAQIKEANGKCDETKEVAQNLQDENTDLRKALQSLKAEFNKAVKANHDLASDKANLVSTMQALMRDNSRFKHGLEKEKDLEEKEAKELAADKATLSKLSKKESKPVAKKKAKSLLKVVPGHRKHAESTAAQMAHMRTIDKYIDNAEADSDDFSEQQLSAVQRQEELFKKGKVGTHLSDWLGIKAQVPKAAAAEKKLAKKPKAIADDGGESEAEDILSDAKAQLAAMEAAAP